MWIHTDLGFMSVVEYDPAKDPKRPKGKNAKKKYPHVSKKGTHLLVRARVEADLNDLKAFFPPLVVEDDGAADYRFRAILPREKFAEFMISKVMEIDYDSHFKEVVEKRLGAAQGHAAGRERHTKLMSIWSTMASLQPGGTYSSWKDDKWGGYGGASYSGYDYGTSGTSYSGTSRYDVKGKYGSTYASALGVTDMPMIDPIGYTDDKLWDGVLEQLEGALDYEEARRRLGYSKLTALDLEKIFESNGWKVSLGDLNEAASLDEEAFEIWEILLERHGEGEAVSRETFQQVWDEVLDLDVEINGAEPEIHSLPLDVVVEG